MALAALALVVFGAYDSYPIGLITRADARGGTAILRVTSAVYCRFGTKQLSFSSAAEPFTCLKWDTCAHFAAPPAFLE